WLIENHPDSAAHQSIFSQDERFYTTWKRVAEAKWGNAAVVGNAAKAYRSRDLFTVERYLLRARELELENPHWARELGQLYATGSRALRSSPVLWKDFIPHAKDALDRSNDPAVIGEAALYFVPSKEQVAADPRLRRILGKRSRNSLPFSGTRRLLERAQSLEPDNPRWPEALQWIEELRQSDGEQAAATKSLDPPKKGVLRIRVGAVVQQRRLTNHVAPVYPDAARSRRIQGLVRFNARISPTGQIEDLQLISGHPL
ncbi:MAG: hypothetical protein GY953_24015, partial [bacterium]|nr:hypothetical protein [bacterium]